jgi:hypothetical protein
MAGPSAPGLGTAQAVLRLDVAARIIRCPAFAFRAGTVGVLILKEDYNLD